jgi:hypothetical protein
LTEQDVRDYFLSTSFSIQVPISFDDYALSYKVVKNSKLFGWIPQILGSSYSCVNMNLEPENEGKNYERRMTIQVADRQKL